MRFLHFYFAGLALVIIGSASANPVIASRDWPTYINVLHHYHICYPVRILTPQGETDNSAGQAFRAIDGAELQVYAWFDGEGSSLSQNLLSAAATSAGRRGKIRNRSVGRGWGNASGETGHGQLFYIKMFKRDDRIVKAEFRYPKAASTRYKPVIDRISHCFGLSLDLDP